MHHKLWARVLLMSVVGLELACAHSLSAANRPGTVQFTPGKTTKRDVANALGLPFTREKKGEKEGWGYVDGPALASLDVPYGGTTRTIAVTGKQEIVITYVFDAQGVLVEVQDHRGKR